MPLLPLCADVHHVTLSVVILYAQIPHVHALSQNGKIMLQLNSKRWDIHLSQGKHVNILCYSVVICVVCVQIRSSIRCKAVDGKVCGINIPSQPYNTRGYTEILCIRSVNTLSATFFTSPAPLVVILIHYCPNLTFDLLYWPPVYCLCESVLGFTSLSDEYSYNHMFLYLLSYLPVCSCSCLSEHTLMPAPLQRGLPHQVAGAGSCLSSLQKAAA